MSEMKDRAAEAREVASSCDTLREFAIRMDIGMETALHWNAELALDLPFIAPRKGKARIGVPSPKPKPKGK